MPIFRVKSIKIFTGQKKFTRTPSAHPWQIWGMIFVSISFTATPSPPSVSFYLFISSLSPQLLPSLSESLSLFILSSYPLFFSTLALTLSSDPLTLFKKMNYVKWLLEIQWIVDDFYEDYTHLAKDLIWISKYPIWISKYPTWISKYSMDSE